MYMPLVPLGLDFAYPAEFQNLCGLGLVPEVIPQLQSLWMGDLPSLLAPTTETMHSAIK